MQIEPTSIASTVGTRTVPEAQTDISADFETFLTLLTAQLRSQDPLNPVDSTEFIAQLASFSAVEQQTRTNELLARFLENATSDGPGALVSLVGSRVTAPVAVPYAGEGELEFSVVPDPGADSAVMTIYDDFGAPVANIVVDPRLGSHSWRGELTMGGTAPAGNYRAEITYVVDGRSRDPVPASGPATVREVRFTDGTARLVLDGGALIDPDQITAILSAE